MENIDWEEVVGWAEFTIQTTTDEELDEFEQFCDEYCDNK